MRYPLDSQSRKLAHEVQDTQHHAERLASIALRALQALATTRPQAARTLRVEAVQATRGVFPGIARQLLNLPLESPKPGNLPIMLTLRYDPPSGLTEDQILRELNRVLEAIDPEITVHVHTS